MNKSVSLSIILYLVFTSFALAKPNCFLMQGNERLTNHCLLESVQGRLVDEQTMQIVVSRLQREGYFGGLETPSYKGAVFPDVYYSENINGGNPNKKLVLGNLEFDGDPNLIAKEGIMIGLNASGSGRKTIGTGRYLDGHANLSYGFSPEHDLSIQSANFSLCSKNRLKDNVYADLCVSASELRKDITSDSAQSIKASVSKFNLLDFGSFNEGRLSILRFDTDDYSQNQLEASIDAIHRENLSTSIKLKVGQELTDQLAMKYGYSISATTNFRGRKYTLGLTDEYSDGGKLFGTDRSDRTRSVSISTSINQSTKISFGYFSRDSDVDYFDTTYPVLRLTRTILF